MSKIDKILSPDDVEELLKSSFRTTALFELLANKAEFVTIGDITQNLNIPQSSASMLVKSLLDTGYLQKDPTHKKYQLSVRLAFLGASTLHNFPKLPELTEQVQQLRDVIGETIVVAMRNGLYSQYVFVSRIEGQNIDEHVTLGSMRPLVCSATGWAMLINADEDEIGKLVRTTCAEVDDPYWVETAKHAPVSIEETKQHGFAVSQGPSRKGTAGIAFPLNLGGHQEQFSIGVAGTEQDLVDKKHIIISNLKAHTQHFN